MAAIAFQSRQDSVLAEAAALVKECASDDVPSGRLEQIAVRMRQLVDENPDLSTAPISGTGWDDSTN